MKSDAPIRNVSDTALWVAMYRARESERPDAVFHDPLARRLAGDRGEQIVAAMRHQDRNAWAYVARTFLFDSFVSERVFDGVDLVVNLAAGLDTRPYRMDLPPELRWVEVDLPDILAYKEELLAGETPRCRVERVAADLSDGETRRSLLARLAAESRRAPVLSEGLLVYLTAEEALGLGRDLSSHRAFHWWAFDIASPPLLKMMQKQVGASLDRANAPLQFAPVEGPWYFEPAGWRVLDVRGSLKTAAKLDRLSFLFRLVAKFPEKPRGGKQIWAGTCLLENVRSG